MPEKNHGTSEIEKSSKVFVVIFPADHQPPEVVKPREKALHFPTPAISAQRSPILGAADSIGSVRRDHLNAAGLGKIAIKRIAVVGLVTNEPLGSFGQKQVIQRRFHQSHFSRRSAFCPSGDRKTIAVDDSHDLGSLASLGLPDLEPPFFAETNVPSMKHSSKSSWPRSRRSSASFTNRSSKKPCSLQF